MNDDPVYMGSTGTVKFCAFCRCSFFLKGNDDGIHDGLAACSHCGAVYDESEKVIGFLNGSLAETSAKALTPIPSFFEDKR